ncbi:MAG: nucleotide sugar dehydrogenase [Nitrospinota bacterium]|nr:MAG: nucleotide sugar dehydrogenase [Nitrospinota bacterium]
MLREKIASRTARVGIIGLGYVGLPLAVAFAKAGFPVTGIDIDGNKVTQINAGKSYIQDVSSHELHTLREQGKLQATSDFTVLQELDTVSICVPTPLSKTKDPDISFIASVTSKIAEHLHAEQLIVLESTTYPGTTEEFILPELTAKGLQVGVDFYLAFSPERLDPGNPHYTAQNIPKIIGGITPACTAMAQALYSQAMQKVIPVSSAKTAEMVKLLENTFRAVNIALVNEIAIMCDRLEIDVWEVIEAAATKPFGFMPFYPGPGWGGHCIPVDPFYLSWKLKTLNYKARFIELAAEVNTHMPLYVVTKLADILNEHQKSIKGSKILMLGVTYKRDVSDVRESPALDILRILQQKGANLSFYDPYVQRLEEASAHWVPLTEQTLAGADCVVIVTDHQQVDYKFVVEHAPLILDTRNATKEVRTGREKIRLL